MSENIKEYVEQMRANPYVKEKELGNGISSFNFTRKAFKKNILDAMTCKARGLFVDVTNYEIVARSFDKFFEDGQNGESVEELSYPVSIYEKYNGFLGITSGGLDGKELFVASKSTNQGEFRDNFKRILDHVMSQSMQSAMANYLYRNNRSAIFEVIDPKNDPHIVNYDHETVVLIALVENEVEFKQARHEELKWFAELINVPYRKRISVEHNAESLLRRLHEQPEKEKEGYVLEDADGHMMKFKNPWYKKWKYYRGRGQYFCAHPEKWEAEIGNEDPILDMVVHYYWDNEDANIVEFRKRFCFE